MKAWETNMEKAIREVKEKSNRKVESCETQEAVGEPRTTLTEMCNDDWKIKRIEIWEIESREKRGEARSDMWWQEYGE